MLAIARTYLYKIGGILPGRQFIRLISVFDGPVASFDDLAYASRKFPTVSTIINKTMPVENIVILHRWQEKMRKEMGHQQFNDYVSRIKGLGKDAHQAICDILMKEKRVEQVSEPIDGYIRSLEAVFSRLKVTHFVESECYHPVLQYRGRFDSINSFKQAEDNEAETLVLTEWKTVHESKRVTSLEKTYDAPLQVAAYAAAFNATRPANMPPVRQGLIAYAYADGYPADVLILDEEALEHFFQMWRERVETYYKTPHSTGQ